MADQRNLYVMLFISLYEMCVVCNK